MNPLIFLMLSMSLLGTTRSVAPTARPQAATSRVALGPTAFSNSWGPIETNRSNGEQDADDGASLQLGGVRHARGIGTHAPSALTFSVPPRCTTFDATVGVDDEVGDAGSVVFEVHGDGAVLYRSGRLTGRNGPTPVRVNVGGRRTLRLVVTDAGDGNAFDHANWASARLSGCAAGPLTLRGPRPGVPVGAPLVVTRGGTYRGNWESFDPKVPAVLIRTSQPVVLESCTLRGRGHLIQGDRVRLTVRNCRGAGLNPNIVGRAKGDFVHLSNVLNLRVEGNEVTGLGGVVIRGFRGSNAGGEGIRILRNRLRDIDGRLSDGRGGYQTGGGRYESAREVRNAVLFDKVQRIRHAQIAWNEVVNRPWNSLVEDNINMYVSSGLPDSPILIHDNYIQGAYQTEPDREAWYAGGGIIVGDGVGSVPEDNGFVRVYGNHVVGTTNYGLSIVGGVGSEVFGNRVVNSGRLPNGRAAAYSNVGLVMWDFGKVGQRTPPLFGRNVMRDNVVAWTQVKPDGSTVNNLMFGIACELNGSRCHGNANQGTATLEVEAAEYGRWQAKLGASRMAVGVR